PIYYRINNGNWLLGPRRHLRSEPPAMTAAAPATAAPEPAAPGPRPVTFGPALTVWRAAVVEGRSPAPPQVPLPAAPVGTVPWQLIHLVTYLAKTRGTGEPPSGPSLRDHL